MFRAAAQIDSPPTGADLRPRSSKIFGFVAVHVQGVGQGGVKPPHSPSQAAQRLLSPFLRRAAAFRRVVVGVLRLPGRFVQEPAGNRFSLFAPFHSR